MHLSSRPLMVLHPWKQSCLLFGPTNRRNFATQLDPPPIPDKDLEWPLPPTRITPYTIFNIPNRAAYTVTVKHKFSRLVKLYHPDSYNNCLSNVNGNERLQRFRLVIAAHEIMSDPTKKSVYDRFGAGWAGSPGVVGCREATNSAPTTTYPKYGPDSPFQNATWEDWERWRTRQTQEAQAESSEDKERRAEDNANFVMAVLFLGILGWIIQFSRLETHRERLAEERDRTHAKINRDLSIHRKDMSTFGTRDERVQNFLKIRDPAGFGMSQDELREEKLKRILPPAEVCMSEGVQNSED